MANKLKKGKAMGKKKTGRGKKGKVTDSGEETKSSRLQLLSGSSAHSRAPINKKKYKRRSSFWFNVRKNRKLQKLSVLKGTAGREINREESPDSKRAAKNQPVTEGVITRSQSQNICPKVVRARKVVVKRIRSKNMRTRQIECVQNEAVEDYVPPPSAAGPVIDPPPLAGPVIDSPPPAVPVIDPPPPADPVIDPPPPAGPVIDPPPPAGPVIDPPPPAGPVIDPPPPAGPVIDPPPPDGPVIDLEAAECVLQNNQLYREHNMVLDEEPQIGHDMEALDIPLDLDVDLLLRGALPNEEQKNFMANLSQAIMDVLKQKQTYDYLEGIFHNRIQSYRHANFIKKGLYLQHDYTPASGAGPFHINEAALLIKIMKTVLRKIATENEIQRLGDIDAYILNVWLPDFIVFAVQNVMKCSYEKAEEVFFATSAFL